MKHIHLNLKRFDILPEFGGVNHLVNPKEWGSFIIENLNDLISSLGKLEQDVNFTVYLPEVHLLGALGAQNEYLSIGCQSIYREDTSIGGNFGAYTTHRTGNSMKQIGVTATIIGHLEERLDKKGVLANAGVSDFSSIDKLLNKELLSAQNAGLNILYCVGETLEQRHEWKTILKKQLDLGLENVELSNVTIAYEPVWAIGPGKIPPTTTEVKEVVQYIKKLYPELSVIYGGGLKLDNVQSLAEITELDGGLIALTRFTEEIGFYPDEYIEIVRLFLKNAKE
ncbi:triosephosphate isomerase [Tuanshanicoccus lijuaniae]|uniref:triose-phosphate isomerase n=1 Tax=Aerococcaceae bacterium zg-1292 TaxID=2774330 RepID=UPI001938F4D4|nr:triosephosphate isomerase [Aerococcaceae bacterium zg-1292]MBF6978198.1 triosephosphate isomerase [Aerococcaceae bacterium zg-BR22]MBS4456416.1 triosephosphate isomerase [Aerococcaceae bacterium zg-A91]MBS4458266.1 triosephosphate isomerase [Aerococcaceae bacterium zg-BR33]QQA37501.1 triosephosphate isomerase [Aerococcaceae bacterium zg-1292]